MSLEAFASGRFHVLDALSDQFKALCTEIASRLRRRMRFRARSDGLAQLLLWLGHICDLKPKTGATRGGFWDRGEPFRPVW